MASSKNVPLLFPARKKFTRCNPGSLIQGSSPLVFFYTAMSRFRKYQAAIAMKVMAMRFFSEDLAENITATLKKPRLKPGL
ncbi:MAG: hypothetical protein WCT27_04390 [Patescibacteria group bacterium]